MAVKEEKNIDDLCEQIKEQAIHGFMVTDDNILDLWGDVVWVYRTYCGKRGIKKQNIKKILEKNKKKTFKVDKVSLTRNPRLVTCPFCQTGMSKQVNKISEETYNIILDSFDESIDFLSKLNTDKMLNDIYSSLRSVFRASMGVSLSFLEDFDAEKHKISAERLVKSLKKNRDIITTESLNCLNELKILIDKYEEYYNALEEEV